MTEIYILNSDDEILVVLSEETGLLSTRFREEVNRLPDEPFTFIVEADHEQAEHVKEENQVVFRDKEGDFRLYVIKELDDSNGSNGPATKATCEPAFMELKDHIVVERRLTEQTADVALNAALEGTRWTGEVTAQLGQRSSMFYYIPSVDAIWKILEVWGGDFKDVVGFDLTTNKITARIIKLLPRLGANRGRWFEIDHNVEEIQRVLLSYPVTALYGRGASLELQNEDGNATGGNSRYIGFEDVEWKKSKGDPVDKPLGQKWVGDPDALQKYGHKHGSKLLHREGIYSNQDLNDPEDLLRATWYQLQDAKEPEVNYRLSIHLIEHLPGYEDHPVSLGDTAIAVDRMFARPIEVQARVIALEYDVLDPDETAIAEMGQFLSINDPHDKLDRLIDTINDNRDKWESSPPMNKDRYPDIKPQMPANVTVEGAFQTIQLQWDFSFEMYVVKNFEVYSSQVKGFAPGPAQLVYRGMLNSFSHLVDTDQTWYYRIRAVNHHERPSEFTAEFSGSTVRIITEDILFGAVTAEKIRDLSIIAEKLAEGAVTAEKIGTGAVIAAKIADGAVEAAKIRNGAITGAKLFDGAVTYDKLAPFSVDSDKIREGAVTSDKLVTGAVTNIKLGNLSVDAAKIAAGAVSNEKIVDGAVSTAKIGHLAVDSAKLAANAVTSAKVLDGAIAEAKLAAGAVTSGKIFDKAITNPKLAALAVDAEKLASGAVTEGKLSPGAVTNSKLASLAVDAAKLANGAVTNAKILDGAVAEAKIAAGAVTSGKIDGGAITNEKLANLAVDAAKLANGSVTENKVGAGAITNTKLGALAVDAAKLADSAVTATKIANLAVGNAAIANGAIDNAKIANLSVNAAKIDDGAITSAKIANLAVGTGAIQDAAITNAKIQSLDAAKITTGRLDAARVQIGSGTQFADGYDPAKQATEIFDRSYEQGVGRDPFGQRALEIIKAGTLDPNPDRRIFKTSRGQHLQSEFIPYNPNERIFGEIEFYNESTASGIFYFGIEFYDGEKFSLGSNNLTFYFVNDSTTITDQWLQRSGNYKPGSSAAQMKAAYIRVRVLTRHSAQAGVTYFKGLSLKQGGAITAGEIKGQAKASADRLTLWQFQDTSFIDGGNIYANSITANQIAAGAITAQSGIIADAAITSAKIADLAVGNAAIANGSITNAKIASLAVDTAKIQDAAINAAKIANLAVGTAAIQDAAITNVKVANLDAAKITTGRLDAARVQIGSGTTFAPGFDPTTKATPDDVSLVKDLASAYADGKLVFDDPVFINGENDVRFYNNAGGGTVTVNRVPKGADSPSAGTHELEVKTSGPASPGYGGAVQYIRSRPNAKFVQRFIAKLPIGYRFLTASNSMGAGFKDRFLTSTAGTGKYEEYIRMVECGADGNFSSGGHIYVLGSPAPTAAVPLTWRIASFALYDLTDTDYTMKESADRLALWQYADTSFFDGGNIYTNTITANQIAAGTITAAQIASQTITGNKLAANTITADQIAGITITADKLAANAVTAAKIAAGTITALEISALAITGDKIAANAITSAKIATNAVTANEIAANTITAAQIATNAITSDKILANAITAVKIAAGTITANEIAGLAITGDKIAANAITSAKIAANAVTANEIAAGTIRASEIASNAITSDKILANAITAGKIAVNGVTAENIAAGAITTEKLYVLAKNKVNDFGFGSLDGWRQFGTGELQNASTSRGRVARTLSSGSIQIASELFEVDPSKGYKFKLGLQSPVNSGRVYFGLNAYDKDQNELPLAPGAPGGNWGTPNTNRYFYHSDLGQNFGSWFDLESFVMSHDADTKEIPELKNANNAYRMDPRTKYLRMRFLSYDNAAPTTVHWHSPSVTEINSGIITANQIAANTITALQIAAGTITASSGIIADATITSAKIANLAVGTAAIANGAITRAKLETAIIGTAQIENAAITSAKVQSLNADKINASTLSAISANLGVITAGTITTLQVQGVNSQIYFGPSSINFEGRIDYVGDGMRFQRDASTYLKVNPGGSSGSGYHERFLHQLFGAGAPMFNFGFDGGEHRHRIIGSGNTMLKFLAGSITTLQVRNRADTNYTAIAASEFNTASSREFKMNIETLKVNGLEAVNSLTAVTYDFIEDFENGRFDNRQTGFIAEDSHAISTPDGKAISTYKLGTLNTKAIQELHGLYFNQDQRINKLEIENQLLKARLKKLESCA